MIGSLLSEYFIYILSLVIGSSVLLKYFLYILFLQENHKKIEISFHSILTNDLQPETENIESLYSTWEENIKIKFGK